MFSLNYTKFLLCIVAAVSLFPACRFWQKTAGGIDNPDAENQPKAIAPFRTKEPEVYQAEVFMTTFVGGAKSEKKYFVAKDSEKYYFAFGVGEENETAILRQSKESRFILTKRDKSYREETSGGPAAEGDGLRKFLTTKWLNEKRNAKFERLGTENTLAKYRVTIDDSKLSETIIFIDEELNLPLRQDFYIVRGDKKDLTFTVEIRNFKKEVPEKIFELPKDYRKAAPAAKL